MPLRLAIVGLGAAARNIHLPAYAQLGDAIDVVAACDVDAGSNGLAGTKWARLKVYDDARRMLHAERPDVVSVCTPPALHYTQVLAALEHGCHVFCEKPLAETLAQADEIIATAAAAKRQVVVNTQFPCMRIHAAAKERLGTPEFGRLLFLHAWQTFHPSPVTEAGWRGSLQRRVCFEFGVHVFELVRFFFEAMPVRLYCHIPRPGLNGSVEAINVVSLEFADGRAASIVLDRLSRAPERYLDMRLDGEVASICTSIGGEVRFEIGLHTRTRRPFAGLHLVKGGKAVLHTGSGSTVIAQDGLNPFATATAVHLKRFLDCLQTGTTPPATARDNRNTLAMALAAYDSAESGQALDMAAYLANAP
jgi:predicted dehydrogenase